jgi:hypothetical protein
LIPDSRYWVTAEEVRMRSQSFPWLLPLLFALPAAQADILRVTADSLSPFPTIQAAVEAARDGDIVTLADGVYRGTGNRDIDLLGKRIIVRSASGHPENCVLDCEHRGRGFYLNQSEGADTHIIGITVTHGYAKTGGAIYCGDHVAALIRDCVFIDNEAETKGGALHIAGSEVKIVRCLMADNRASDHGGAVYICCCSRPELINLTLVNNSAGEGSAVSSVGFSLPRLARSIIAFNRGGQAVFFRIGSGHVFTALTNIYGNSGGDWVGDIAEDLGKNGNMSTDPLFVAPQSGNYSLGPLSPCRIAVGQERQVLGAIMDIPGQ